MPIGRNLIDADGVTGGHAVGNAGLWVLRRYDDDITQAANTPIQCIETGGINAIVIG
jgi:hypothetical protein